MRGALARWQEHRRRMRTPPRRRHGQRWWRRFEADPLYRQWEAARRPRGWRRWALAAARGLGWLSGRLRARWRAFLAGVRVLGLAWRYRGRLEVRHGALVTRRAA